MGTRKRNTSRDECVESDNESVEVLLQPNKSDKLKTFAVICIGIPLNSIVERKKFMLSKTTAICLELVNHQQIITLHHQIRLSRRNGTKVNDCRAAWWDEFPIYDIVSSSVRIDLLSNYAYDSVNGFAEVEFYTGISKCYESPNLCGSNAEVVSVNECNPGCENSSEVYVYLFK